MKAKHVHSVVGVVLCMCLGLVAACAGLQGPIDTVDSGLTQAPLDAGLPPGDGGPPVEPPDAGVDFSACADAGVLHYCPGMGEAVCRLELLREKFASGCSLDAECVKADYASNCLAHGLCEPRLSVLASRKSDFEAAIAAELAWYCGRVNCGLSGSCVVMQTSAVCEQGRCQTR